MTCSQKKVFKIHASNINIPLPIDLDFPFWGGGSGDIIPVDLTDPPLGIRDLLGVRVTSLGPDGIERQDASWISGTGVTIHGPRTIHITFPGVQGSGNELFDITIPGLYALVVEVIKYVESTTMIVRSCWEAGLDTCIEVYTTEECPPSCEGGS